jgi:hypothetical protein
LIFSLTNASGAGDMEQVMTKREGRDFKTEEAPVTMSTAPATAPAGPPLPEPLRGDPAMIALPTVIAGAVGLFLTTIGFVPASAGLAAIPVILAATVLGLLISTIWAAMLGQNVVATLYAVFLGFMPATSRSSSASSTTGTKFRPIRLATPSPSI